MSEPSERSALDRPVPLLDYARRLHRQTPDAPLPDGGRPAPGSGTRPRLQKHEERKAALVSLLREFADNPAAAAPGLNERCAGLTVSHYDVSAALKELALEPSAPLLDAARWLVGNATNPGAVLVGLGLLAGHAERRDVAMITMIGRLRFADQPSVALLATIPGAEGDLIWLAERSRPPARLSAVRALSDSADPAVRDWVRSTPGEFLDSGTARRIAQAHQLARMLAGPDADTRLWDQAGTLLLAMTSTPNYRHEIGRYEEAPAAYAAWIAAASRQPPTLDRAALLVTASQDLSSGPAAPVAGDDRHRLVAAIKDVLTSPEWQRPLRSGARSGDPVEARRARWAIDAIDALAAQPRPHGRFAVRVVVPDPRPTGFPVVEARVMIDGMPAVAAAFDKGPAASPEYLLGSGRLRAGAGPAEVRLAEAYCTEGCCGGLYVTIERDGSQVAWKNWRSSMRGDPPGAVRFDAAEYDAEVARAEQDHSWEWPARTVARLIAEQLRADPGILGRWDCSLMWCTAWLKDFDLARLTFRYPASAAARHDPWVQLGLVVEAGERSPEAVAADVLQSLRDTGPKAITEIIGGSRDGAERLGLRYRKPGRW